MGKTITSQCVENSLKTTVEWLVFLNQFVFFEKVLILIFPNFRPKSCFLSNLEDKATIKNTEHINLREIS